MKEVKVRAEENKQVDSRELRLVSVLLPFATDALYTYMCPADLALARGDYVYVSFGSSKKIGVVWQTDVDQPKNKKIKTILQKIEALPLSNTMCNFIDWVAYYTLAPLGAVLKMAMTEPEALFPPKKKTILHYHLASEETLSGVSLTSARAKVVEALTFHRQGTLKQLKQWTGVSRQVITTMAEKGFLGVESIEEEPEQRGSQPFSKLHVPLNAEQEAAAHEIKREDKFAVFVLDGVTGSGKTEVYFDVMAKAIQEDKQALILLPEIALSTPFLERFEQRFGVRPFLWHSSVSKETRCCTWRATRAGDAKVIAGTRSALFLSFFNLGLIVVDEEHDATYKQEEGVIYNARDMAIVRAYQENIPIILSSATPSLETLVNVKQRRYQHLTLSKRYGGHTLPTLKVVDMRHKGAQGGWISPVLKAAMEETLNKSEQVLLFINRRGYAPLTLCRSCGYRFACPHCTAWLVEHRSAHHLRCHHCGFILAKPKVCPSCEMEETLIPCGPGIERLAEEAISLFPKARIELMSSDNVGTLEQTKYLLSRIDNREIDILIGTQMITKGYHFKNMTLVGIVDADASLNNGDLRAVERTYQLLTQVSGRSGREKPGEAIIQTFLPHHEIMEALLKQDRDALMEAEMESRRRFRMPPFGRLVAIIVAGSNLEEVKRSIYALPRTFPKMTQVQLLGPTEAPIAKIRGLHRWRLLIKAERGINVQSLIRQWLSLHHFPRTLRVKIDVDPYSFF